MSSMLDQLLEGADRFLEETVGNDPDVTDVTEDALKECNGKGTMPTNEENTDMSNNPDQNTVGDNVHKEGAEENMDDDLKLSESEMLTADELFNCYSEAVVEVLRESKKAITQKYNDKKTVAKLGLRK